MTTEPRCPHCRQPTRQERVGVHFGPVKVRIFDALRAAGDIGVSADEMVSELADDAGKPRSRYTIKSHIYQINELLAGTDWRVASDRHRPWRWYLRREAP